MRASVALVISVINAAPLYRGRECLELRVTQVDGSRRHILLEVRDRRGTRNGYRVWRPAQQPCQCDLTRCRSAFLSNLGDLVRAGKIAGPDGRPRDEAQALVRAEVEYLFGRAVEQTIAVLNGRDRRDQLGREDLPNRHVR